MSHFSLDYSGFPQSFLDTQKPCWVKAFWTWVDVIELDGNGRGGIRTHGDLAVTTLFESVTINHSVTLPVSYGALPS